MVLCCMYKRQVIQDFVYRFEIWSHDSKKNEVQSKYNKVAEKLH